MDSPPLSPLGFEFDSDEEIDDILTQMQDEGWFNWTLNIRVHEVNMIYRCWFITNTDDSILSRYE